MKVLIAGPGYVGASLADFLQQAGHEVAALTYSVESAARLAGTRNWAVGAGDLSDLDSLRSFADGLSIEPEAVVHCASSGRGGVAGYEAVYEKGCHHLQAVFPQASLLFTSSTSVYAQVDGSVVDETSPAEPDRDTGKCLRRTEEAVCQHGGIVARLAGIYGPGRSFILKKFFEGTAVIEGDGGRYLNQAHREDIVGALAHLLERRDTLAGETFNVVDSRPQTQLSIYQWLASHFEKALPPTAPPDYERKRGWTHKRVSNEKLRATGWGPAYPCFQEAVVGDEALVSSILG